MIRVLDELPIGANSPDTVYTTLRTYQRMGGTAHYLYFEKHIQRLNDSLKILGSSTRVDESKIRQAIALIEHNSSITGDLRIKVIITPESKAVYTFAIEPLTTPSSSDYQNGVHVLSHPYLRNRPEAKLYGFVSVQNQIRADTEKDAEEILMLGENEELLEGLSSNFFTIIDGILRTAGKGVLHGITRQIVLDLAMRHAIQVDFNPVTMNDLDHVEECFITSTSRGILPVVEVDNKVIGSGFPGPITSKLMIWFDSEIGQLISPI